MTEWKRLKSALLSCVLLSVHSAGLAFDAVSAEIATGNRTQLLRFGMHYLSPYTIATSATTHLALAWEISAAFWRANHQANEAAETPSLFDVGLTPVLRLSLIGAKGLYGEVGVGLHGLSHRYNNNGRELSTNLQFVSHLGIGYEWVNGADLHLNIQHISNGGIKHPNDGANFVGVRVMQRF